MPITHRRGAACRISVLSNEQHPASCIILVIILDLKQFYNNASSNYSLIYSRPLPRTRLELGQHSTFNVQHSTFKPARDYSRRKTLWKESNSPGARREKKKFSTVKSERCFSSPFLLGFPPTRPAAASHRGGFSFFARRFLAVLIKSQLLFTYRSHNPGD